MRTVHVRTAHVLGKGGLLAPLFLPFRLGLGATLGSGNAWLPWVHIDDIVSLYIYALEHEAVEAVREAGLIVRKAVCVVDREEGGADALARHAVRLRALFRAADIVEA